MRKQGLLNMQQRTINKLLQLGTGAQMELISKGRRWFEIEDHEKGNQLIQKEQLVKRKIRRNIASRAPSMMNRPKSIKSRASCRRLGCRCAALAALKAESPPLLQMSEILSQSTRPDGDDDVEETGGGHYGYMVRPVALNDYIQVRRDDAKR